MVAIQNKPSFFHYKHFLKKNKISYNDVCTLCFREKETIEYVLYECEKVQRFLSTVSTWFFEYFTFDIVIEKKNIYSWFITV